MFRTFSLRSLCGLAAASLLIAGCAGGAGSPGQPTTPQLSPAGHAVHADAVGIVPTPTPSPTATPAQNGAHCGGADRDDCHQFKLIAALQLASDGTFTVVKRHGDDGCHAEIHDAPAFVSQTALTLALATVTLPICDSDRDEHHDDGARVHTDAVGATPTPQPASPTPTPAGSPTHFFIVKVAFAGTHHDNDEDDAVITALAGPATSANGQLTFQPLVADNAIAAGTTYEFFIATFRDKDDQVPVATP